MNRQEIYQRIEADVLTRIREGEVLQMPLEQWGDLLYYHANGVAELAADGCYPEAAQELRKLLALGVCAAQEHGRVAERVLA